MKEYIKSISATNEILLSNKISLQEASRFSKSDIRWAENKKKSFQTRTIRKGEVYQFEFGKNYIPEMSYEHRGLVIGINEKLLYVLPIFTYDPIKHKNVYHCTDNPQSKSNLFLLKNTEFSFIKHDSVLKLNDMRTVSINRILYLQQDGRIDINSDIYKNIELLVIAKYFPSFLYEYNNARQKETQLNQTIKDLQSQILCLNAQLENIANIRTENTQDNKTA